jgi:hypothetical protein
MRTGSSIYECMLFTRTRSKVNGCTLSKRTRQKPLTRLLLALQNYWMLIG